MKDLFDLLGKIVLVTGASSGMGKAIAEAMCAHGATVIVSSIDGEGCSNIASQMTQSGGKAYAIPCDVSLPKDMDALIEKSLAKFGRIDVLVSAVGLESITPFLDISLQEFQQLMQINLHAGLYLSQKVIPGMVKHKDGVIIFLSSIASVRGNKTIGLYGMTKAGVVQMARNLAVLYGPDNIRVNAISPGLINTPFAQALIEQKDFMQKRLQLTPLRRVGLPEEIAGMAVLLAAKTGAFITGQNIIIDGGTTITDGN